MKFGDILRLSDSYIKTVPTCYKGKRIMFVYQANDHITAICVRTDPRERSWSSTEIGTLTHYSGKDVWEVADE